MTKTLNQIFFFYLHQNQNIFFSNIGNQNIFLEKKPYPPPPLQVKWSFPNDIKKFWISHVSRRSGVMDVHIWNKFITQEERTCNVIWTHFLSEKQTYHCSVTDHSNLLIIASQLRLSITLLMLKITVYKMSDYRGVGLLGCRTIGMSDYWGVGLSGCRTIGVSDYWGWPWTTTLFESQPMTYTFPALSTEIPHGPIRTRSPYNSHCIVSCKSQHVTVFS